jgi:peptide/nickel transport system ATP-binding protein
MKNEKRTTANDAFVMCDNLVKIYKVADLEVVALQGLDLVLAQGEMMALVGPSGAGKSTLLNVIGGLDAPSAGSVEVAGWDLLKAKDRDRVQYKRDVVGFVWQQPSRNLLPYLSARENVELPMQLNNAKAGTRRNRALALLDVVGLAERADFRPDQLSGGEQQRVALAVALANNPPLVLGDELTGQVDSEAAAQVFDALVSVNQAYGTTIIVVTHDPLVASRMTRVVAIRDGRTSTEIRRRRDQNDGKLYEEEWVILDQVGRMQVPRAYIDTLEMRERVRVRLEPGHISVWPQKDARPDIPDLKPTPQTVLKTDKRVGVTVTTTHLSRTFELGAESIQALRDVTLHIPAGKLAVVKGPSGSGKTTLLNLVAGLDEPTSGTVRVGEHYLAEMSPQERIHLRRRWVGFIFQTFGLLPFLSVDENLQVPMRLLKASPHERQTAIDKMLAMVNLEDRAKHRTYELSGGEQQRVAIARALVKRPFLILADEPTGQLDTLTGASIIALLRDVVDQTGVTVVVASHDPKVHAAADISFELADGLQVKTDGSQSALPRSHDAAP